MFEPGMMRRRVDERNKAELRDSRKPPERSGVDDFADPACERNIQLGRKANQIAPRIKADKLRNF